MASDIPRDRVGRA